MPINALEGNMYSAMNGPGTKCSAMDGPLLEEITYSESEHLYDYMHIWVIRATTKGGIQAHK